jgi:hypothetical protein
MFLFFLVLAAWLSQGCGSASPLDIAPADEGSRAGGGSSNIDNAVGSGGAGMNASGGDSTVTSTGSGGNSSGASPGANAGGSISLPVGAVDAGVDPFAAAPVCTSGTRWTGGNRGSPLMHPGVGCLSCHSNGRAPRFFLAGTVYPTGHEPDDCNGSSAMANANVIITGADGATLTLPVNTAGNFYSTQAVPLPFAAKVVRGASERAMQARQTNGDCNGCHTQTGANGAPGRIVLP